MNSAQALLLLIPSCIAHMSMQFPYPRDNGGAYAKWEQNEPQFPVHPQICHGLAKDSYVRSGNTFSVGQTINIDLYGTASHSGGHCAFWYSTDDVTFTKIIDIKDCTLRGGAQVTLPTTMPAACGNRCTFAWSWIPRVSGACEIYMNCADIRVTGARGGSSSAVSMNFLTNFQYASGYGCQRVNENTHFSASFGAVNTNSNSISTVTSSNGGVSTVSETPNSVNHNVCYLNPYKAINVNHQISVLGRCGNGNNDYRCDDGNCCSQYGYCGSSAGYCANAIGDWRTTLCSSAAFENNPVDSDSDADVKDNEENGKKYSTFFIVCLIISGIFGFLLWAVTYTCVRCYRKKRGKQYFEQTDEKKEVVEDESIEIVAQIEDGQQMITAV